jgi:hypothetical protein
LWGWTTCWKCVAQSLRWPLGKSKDRTGLGPEHFEAVVFCKGFAHWSARWDKIRSRQVKSKVDPRHRQPTHHS